MWIFTNGINIGASRLIGDAVNNEIKETKAYRSNTAQTTNLNVVGIMREDHLRYGESIESVIKPIYSTNFTKFRLIFAENH